MPVIVLKADRDQDLYVEWSTIVEAPTFVGTRDEMLAYLAARRATTSSPMDSPSVRVARADRTGTSALYPDEPPYDGAFDDTGFIVEQRGWLPRAKLAEFARLAAVDSEERYALLEPLEDDDS